MTMIMTNVHEIKAKLSEYLEAVERGERVVICRRNTPVAELRAVAPTRVAPRNVGGAAGTVTVPESFFEALPEDVLGAFESAPLKSGVSLAAERRTAAYAAPAARKRRAT